MKGYFKKALNHPHVQNQLLHWCEKRCKILKTAMFLKAGVQTLESSVTLDYSTTYVTYDVLLDSAPNLGPLISRWEINKFENC
jgi:hypothetical protein